MTDWAPDGPGWWRLQVELTPPDLGAVFVLPKTSCWYVRAPEGYPQGLIDILPAVIGGITGIFPHQSRYEAPEGAPYRREKICVATDSENNLRKDAQAEPKSAEDRLAWHVLRALSWIGRASHGTLLAPGDPFELPVYSATSPAVFFFREGPEDLARWESIGETAGLADVRLLNVGRSPMWVVSAFRALHGRVLFEPAWGTGIESRWSPARVALWLRVPRVIVLPPYAGPSTWGETAKALAAQGVDLLSELQQATVGRHDGLAHPLLIGFPVPNLIDGPDRQTHWLAVDLPALERRAAHGFRQDDLGLWMASSMGTFSHSAQVRWASTQNWHPEELATRGRLTPDLAGARVLLVGAGALGSAVAELLVRVGVINLTVVDGDTLEAGNLVRHTLTLDHLELSKAEGLATRLNAATPSARVTAHPDRIERLLNPDFLDDFDVVVETTGAHAVLELLGGVEAAHPLAYASLGITMHARHLVAYLTRGSTFPVRDFDGAYTPLAHAELDRDEERPMEGVGCWHPVFPARADQVWLMAAAAIELLNQSWPMVNGRGALHVFERTADDAGNFTGIRRVSP